jgi:uncharacterized protein (TIGR02246 family)
LEVSSPARRWIETYERAWEALDAEAIAALYADDAVHRSTPFRSPHLGPEGVFEYTRAAFAEEAYEDVRFGEPVEDGDRAAVEYWATMVEAGRKKTLAGCVVLRFDGVGLVTESRDYWHLEEGARSPPEGWGR